MICRVSEQIVPPESISYRVLGFGQTPDLPLRPYSLEYASSEILELLKDDYFEWLRDMRQDFELTGDRYAIEYLIDQNYPPIEKLYEQPNHFSSAIRIFFYRDLFEKSFTNSGETFRWVINDIDRIDVSPRAIVIEVKAYERGDPPASLASTFGACRG